MRTGVSAKTANAAVKEIAAASKKIVRNLFMNFFSPFFSRHGAGNKLEASVFQKKGRQEGGLVVARLKPSFPNTGGIPVSRYTLRPGSVGQNRQEFGLGGH
jgi:hypothetical protein